MAAGIAGGRALGVAAGVVGSKLAVAAAKTGPVAALTLVMQGSPDAFVMLAQMMNVQGADQLEQTMLIQTAEEYMTEPGASELFSAAAHGGP